MTQFVSVFNLLVSYAFMTVRTNSSEGEEEDSDNEENEKQKFKGKTNYLERSYSGNEDEEQTQNV